MNRVVVNYWRSDSDRWVPVVFQEHRPLGGLERADTVDVPQRVEIERSQAGSPDALERFLNRETFSEGSLVVFAYPDAWDTVLRRLKVEHPLPDGPLWWKEKHVFTEEPPAA